MQLENKSNLGRYLNNLLFQYLCTYSVFVHFKTNYGTNKVITEKAFFFFTPNG